MGADPIGLEGGLNPYAYVGSNPVNAVDPMGLFTVGQMLDESALRAASMDNTIKLAALSFASATWNLFGAENISRWADGQSSSKIGLGFEAAAALPLVGPFSKLGKIATVSELTDRAVVVANSAASVPGRVQSRINLANDGWDHLMARHFSGKANASQFTISPTDLRALLKSPDVIKSPVVRTVSSADGARYVREVDAGRAIGTDRFNGNQSTSIMTIMSDKYGNLVTSFPGVLK